MKMTKWLKDKSYDIYHIPHGKHDTINSLEGLRAIAAFMVFVVHYAAQFTPWIDKSSLTWDLIGYYRHIGAKGVELFFVISGFLIYGMLISKNVPFVTYFKRRIKRLYPTFLVMLFLYIVLSFVFSSENKIPTEPLEAFVYIVQNLLMLPGLFDIKPIMTVAWSLSYEMFLYLSLPLIISVFNLRSWKRNNRIFLLVTSAIAGFAIVNLGYNNHDKMLLFISGMLLFELSKSQLLTRNRMLIGHAFFITILALLSWRYMNASHTLVLLTLFIGFFFTFASCLNKASNFHKFCSSPLLRYFGNMSYSYYLMHGITLKCFFLIFSFIFPPSHQWDIALYLWLIPVFALTWVTSTILFVLVEKPFSLVSNSNAKTLHVRS
ncbi:acyltransferase family protein [Vibrio alfacsensis]|uniref:acyltransferase family protein n=1 Tax=Vibrio alfacsensis TaxID=1074311 RepID=UPI0040682FEB